MKLFVLPGIAVTIASFLVGYFIRDVAIARAGVEATAAAQAELFDFQRTASRLRAKAETALDSAVDTLKKVEVLDAKLKTFESLGVRPIF